MREINVTANTAVDTHYIIFFFYLNLVSIRQLHRILIEPVQISLYLFNMFLIFSAEFYSFSFSPSSQFGNPYVGFDVDLRRVIINA